jgi:predicted ATPase
VNGLLQEVLGSLYQQAAQRQVQLRPGQMDITLSVRGDREALERALYNVILSCVYMAVSGSSVSVTLARRGAYADVRIVFRSTEELTDRLEAFMHHFDKGVPRRSALAMARTVILHHGGQLKGQVLDQECNTEIIVALPLGQAKEQEIDRYDEDLHTDR